LHLVAHSSDSAVLYTVCCLLTQYEMFALPEDRQTAIRPPKPDSLPVLLLHSCDVLHTRFCTPEVRRFQSGSRWSPLICAHHLCVCDIASGRWQHLHKGTQKIDWTLA